MLKRHVSTSTACEAAAISQVALDGNADAFLGEVDTLISKAGATPAEVADAAVSLAYLQATGNRRIWGKILEKASDLKASFDAASLSNFLWAVTTANVEHFRTVYELSAPATKLLKSFSPTQLSLVVEAFGKSKVDDVAFYNAVSDVVASKIAEYKPSELSRILWGYAAAGQSDLQLVKAVGKALSDKDLAFRDAAQAFWAIATLGLKDKTIIDALAKQLKTKTAEYPQDLAALAWSYGTLGIKPDATFSAGIKGAVDSFSTSQQIQAAWGLAVAESGDAATFAALFKAIGAAVDKAPDAISLDDLASLYEASAIVKDAKLEPKVAAYAQHVYELVLSYKAAQRSSSALQFKDDVAETVAVALGNRYRPEITKFLSSVQKVIEGVPVDIAADVGGNKIVVVPVEASQLTSSSPVQPLGSVIALAKVLDSKGYKLVPVLQPEYAALTDTKSKVTYVLNAIKKAVPGASSKVTELQKAAEQPFDPLA